MNPGSVELHGAHHDDADLQIDGRLAYAPGDAGAGRTPGVVAAGYTYNKVNEKITTKRISGKPLFICWHLDLGYALRLAGVSGRLTIVPSTILRGRPRSKARAGARWPAVVSCVPGDPGDAEVPQPSPRPGRSPAWRRVPAWLRHPGVRSP